MSDRTANWLEFLLALLCVGVIVFVIAGVLKLM